MALDNLDRVAALNAVVQAWTEYDSEPFIVRKTINAGDSINIRVQRPWSGIMLCFGGAGTVTGVRMLYNISGSQNHKDISSFTSVSITRSGTTYTITNNHTSAVDFYVISLRGMCEEV